MSETIKKIEDAGPETIEAHGWQIQRGYVYRVEAEDDDAWKCEGADGQPARFGYFGNDYPPCGADYLYADPECGLLVISEKSDPADIDTVDGFTLRAVLLDQGAWYFDGTFNFVVLSIGSDREHIIAGKA